jgi:hypothetical protein
VLVGATVLDNDERTGTRPNNMLIAEQSDDDDGAGSSRGFSSGGDKSDNVNA